MARFGDLVSRVNTKEDRHNTDKTYYVGGEHIESNELSVHAKGMIEGSTIGPMFYFGFKAGDILFVTRNPHLRKAAMVEFDGICSEKTLALATTDESILLQNYLAIVMQSDDFWEYCEDNKSGGVNYFINWSTLEEYEFDLPQIEEQKKIASQIWSAYRLKEAYKSLLAATDEMVKSQFIEMFGCDQCTYLPLREVCLRFGEYGSNTPSIPFVEGQPRYIRITDLNYDGTLNDDKVCAKEIDKKYILSKGDFLFARTGATVGKTYCHREGDALYAGYLIRYVTNPDKILPEFLSIYTKTQPFWSWIQGQMKIGAQPNISSKQYNELPVPAPSIEEQTSFLSFVRQADKSKFDGFKSQFIEMFGNPINNTKNWKISSLKDACVLVSDGPFGSNLKSCHYVQEGVRVIRLQNICQGQFNDTDRAYISNEHYKTLKRYTCNPGEIVIATLGEPNLRACIIPDYIKLSINKADCIHVIPKSDLLNPVFVCSYFNSTQVLHLATSDIHGTTRARIAGGQVANFPVFLPPIKLQEEFAAIVRQADKSKYYVQNKLNIICHILTNQIQLRRCS